MDKGIGKGGAHALVSRAYSLLALILLNPNDLKDEISGRLDEIKKIDLSFLESVGCEECSKVLGGFLEEVSRAVNNDNALEEFEVDYTNVLLSRPGGTLCPLYESLYVINRKAPIGDPRVADSLKEFYSVVGLDVKKGPGIMPDYAPVELEFLAALHEYEFIALSEEVHPDTLKALEEFRREFVNAHPAKWMKELGECIISNSKNALLRKSGELLKCLISCEEIF